MGQPDAATGGGGQALAINWQNGFTCTPNGAAVDDNDDEDGGRDDAAVTVQIAY